MVGLLGIKKHRIIHIIKFVIPIALLAIIVIESRKLFRNLNYELVFNELSQLGFGTIAMIITIGIIGVGPMLFYDVIINKKLNIQLSKRKMFLYSWTANTFSNLVGFGGIAGATLRTYFYKRYIQNYRPLIKQAAGLSIYYLTGLSILCWSLILGMFQTSLLQDYIWLNVIVWGIALYIFVVLFFHKYLNRWKKVDSHKSFTVELIIISIFEWVFAFITMDVLSYVLHLPLTASELFPIYLVAVCAGIVSLIPGGLGTFDLVFMMGLSSYQVAGETIVVLLLLYRLSYYFFPVLIGAIFLLVDSIRQLLTKKGIESEM